MSSRVKSRAWFFTWDNPPDEWRLTISESLSDYEYVCQLEKARSGLIHVQGVMRYPNQRSTWPEISCHWERCRNWKAAVKYCSKVDTRIDGPYTNIKGLSWRRTIVDPLAGYELYEWQKEVIDIIKTKPDMRKVYWFYDRKGNTGKTCLCKHICMNYNATKIAGASKDCFQGIRSYIEERDLDVVMIDIPRCRFNNISFAAIEEIKGGAIFSGKYESKALLFNPPHVIVFANGLPDVSKLSEDRWVIREII